MWRKRMLCLTALAAMGFGGCGGGEGEDSEQAASMLLIDYPALRGAGDQIDRAFYIEAYPGSTLSSVTLWLAAHAEGVYTVRLEARDSTYDGALIGASFATIALAGDLSVPTATSFRFADQAVTPGSVVAFRMSRVAGPGSVYFVVRGYEDADPIVTETHGSDAPLDAWRRDGIAIRVYGMP